MFQPLIFQGCKENLRLDVWLCILFLFGGVALEFVSLDHGELKIYFPQICKICNRLFLGGVCFLGNLPSLFGGSIFWGMHFVF